MGDNGAPGDEDVRPGCCPGAESTAGLAAHGQTCIPGLIRYKPCLLLQIWYGNKRPDGGFNRPYKGLWLGLDGSWMKSHKEWERGMEKDSDVSKAPEKKKKKTLQSRYASKDCRGLRDSCFLELFLFFCSLILFQWSLVSEGEIHQSLRIETIFHSSHNSKLNNRT